MPNYYIEAYKVVPEDYVSYSELVDYVSNHCTGSGVSGISYQDMVAYVNSAISTIPQPTVSGVSWQDMVEYVAQHQVIPTCSGVSYDEMVAYVAAYSTVSGINYQQLVDYVSGVVSLLPTYSGVTYSEMTDYVSSIIASITISGVPTDYLDNKLQSMCDHLHTDMAALKADVITLLYADLSFDSLTFDREEGLIFDRSQGYDVIRDGGEFTTHSGCF